MSHVRTLLARPRTSSRITAAGAVRAAVAVVVATGVLAGCAGPSSQGARKPGGGASPSASPTRAPLAGRVVLLDPGHNPHNRDHVGRIGRLVDVGNARKPCDTTGTSTDDGYAEADFTLDVVRRARTLLRERGARVVLTQDGDRAWGPCVDQRAEAGDRAHADAAVSVHADGAPAGDRGFHVILPAEVRAGAADTTAIRRPSRALGERLADRFAADTGTRRSNYIGNGTGLDVRSDLGGLNLSTVPKVFLECGNMRDPKDAARVTSAAWRERAARGVADGVAAFLSARKD